MFDGRDGVKIILGGNRALAALAWAAGPIVAALLFFLPAPAQANYHCGSPPDPWGDASGYASWCSCMGGSYNWSTTACEGATPGGPTGDDFGGDDHGNDGYYSSPKGVGWYCRAEASNGGWGWGEHSSKAQAESIAHEFCAREANGRRCVTKYCSLNGGPKQAPSRNAGQGTPLGATSGSRPGSSPRTGPATAGCGVCFRKLKADINAGWASASLRTYVSQAIAGYNNCKRRMKESCEAGDRLAGEIQLGCLVSFGEAYKACVVRIMNKY